LYFHNPIFIKWKPTIVFWIFGLAFILSQFIGKKPLVQRMLEKVLEGNANLPPKIWSRLNVAWATFFIILGSVNLFVAYNFTTDVWVNFKVYGIMGILLIFSFIQAVCLSRFLAEGKQ
jgi:intracellular septation protein